MESNGSLIRPVRTCSSRHRRLPRESSVPPRPDDRDARFPKEGIQALRMPDSSN